MEIHNLKIKHESISFKQAIDTGLSLPQKKLSSKYFYDDIGSNLFQKITQQEEYYLTQAEHEILKNFSPEITQIINHQEIDLIELGVGDGHKTKLLIEQFKAAKIKINYFPIDISEQAMTLLEGFVAEDEYLTVTGVVADYMNGVKYIKKLSKLPKLVLFLGSNIGNFDRNNAQNMLNDLGALLNNGDYLFTGFDLKKDIKILTAAYNDKAGVTRAFNMNLLTRINNELNADFKLDQFTHKGVYNEALGTMESFLISNCDQTINIKDLNKNFNFKKDEAIHLEYSYKYSPDEIKEMASTSGFNVVKNFSDSNNYFIDSLWKY